MPALCRPRHAALISALIAVPVPAGAQLLSEAVTDTSRTCIYYGADASPDGQVTPRTVVIGLGQECPATAPYRDPLAPVPPNAQLVGERTDGGNRICLYTEAGLDYRVAIDMTLRCGVTPALTEQARTAAR